MIDLPPEPHDPLEWVGRALDELMDFPEQVRRSMGFALRFAQAGVKHEMAKPLSGFKGAGVLEVVENYDGDTYRAVYTVKFAGVVYVLHCFQKKSKSGIATPQHTMALVQQRLRVAEQTQPEHKIVIDNKENTTTKSSGNVFADLGLPDADDLMGKANLALHIRRTIEARRLTQAQAAALLGLDQPKVSSIINGRLDGFSSDRLMRFLNDLGCDVQITVSAPHPETRGQLIFA